MVTCVLLGSCQSDYAIVAPERIIYIEVEVEVPASEDPEPIEIWVDHFYQSAIMSGIDILWVIDTSGSMNVHQTRLLNGIDAMMNALPITDWRLAIIPADANKALLEYQFPLLPGHGFIEAEIMYNNMLTGPYEEGFDAAYEYIENNTDVATSGWMRDSAALLVVFVSDEEEQGTFSSANDFVNWYTGIRDFVFLASIVNLDPATSLCSSSAHNTGDRYIDATNALSGTVVDICSDDWTAGVAEAAVEMEPVTEIILTHLPIEETIRVFVDGLLYDSSYWYYEASINAVIFTETDTTTGEIIGPPPSTLVEVGYAIDEYVEASSDTGDTGS